MNEISEKKKREEKIKKSITGLIISDLEEKSKLIAKENKAELLKKFKNAGASDEEALKMFKTVKEKLRKELTNNFLEESKKIHL